jgi:hypothetical protein
MNKAKPKTKLKEKSDNLTDQLNQCAAQSKADQTDSAEIQTANEQEPIQPDEKSNFEDNPAYDALFDN